MAFLRISIIVFAFIFAGVFCVPTTATDAKKPNIVFILADDLGYGEIGCYGQKLIKTPNIDRLAREGMMFRQFYAGSTVCAPSRSVLMTGQHVGHTRVRGNAGAQNIKSQMLRSGDFTIAKLLKSAGYKTAIIGKWGLGMPGDEGVPTKQGFDYFFGYLSQTHAHNHYPDYLWRNEEKVPLPNQIVPKGENGAGYATNRVVYAGDLFLEESLKFIESNKDKPFFLFLSVVVPHANNERRQALGDGEEVPDYGIYGNMNWTNQNKGHAASITRLDAHVGQIMKKLEEFGIAENTIVIFTSDNGPQGEGGHDPNFFDANGPLRGMKRDLYEGGIRVPFVVRWKGKIKSGQISDHVCYLGDMMATFAELAGVAPPTETESISIVPTLFGNKRVQKQHRFLYWEFHERGFSQAILLNGRWKGIRLLRRDNPIQLFDLKNDIGEQNNVADKYPEIVNEIRVLMEIARYQNPDWEPKDAPMLK
ncbi:MAG: arylsulfatase [Verrucomicrobiae bacterium]|nr:arylsulfatase [Verrucomicrobiae bacterium]